MEDLNTPLTINSVETDSVTNVVRRGTLPHIARGERINPRRMVTKPVVPVRRTAAISAVPVYQANKSLSKK